MQFFSVIWQSFRFYEYERAQNSSNSQWEDRETFEKVYLFAKLRITCQCIVNLSHKY